MSYEKTVWAGEGTLAREQEYNYHWCYERGIITKAWLDVYAATGDKRFYDAAKANVDQYVTADGGILTYEPEKYNLDMICMGRTALRLFKATGEAKYEKACRRLIEQIKGQPTTAEGGFWLTLGASLLRICAGFALAALAGTGLRQALAGPLAGELLPRLAALCAGGCATAAVFVALAWPMGLREEFLQFSGHRPTFRV